MIRVDKKNNNNSLTGLKNTVFLIFFIPFVDKIEKTTTKNLIQKKEIFFIKKKK